MPKYSLLLIFSIYVGAQPISDKTLIRNRLNIMQDAGMHWKFLSSLDMVSYSKLNQINSQLRSNNIIDVSLMNNASSRFGFNKVFTIKHFYGYLDLNISNSLRLPSIHLSGIGYENDWVIFANWSRERSLGCWRR